MSAGWCKTSSLSWGKVAPDLAATVSQHPNQVQSIIVAGTPSPELLQLVKSAGGTVDTQFPTLGRLLIHVPGKAVLPLAKLATVNSSSPDRVVGARLDYTTAAVGETVALGNGIGGAGVTVAVLDTGVAPHPDLTCPQNRIAGWVDMVNDRTLPYDDNGHGTHVSGIIAGNGWQAYASRMGRALHGMAPQARLVGVKVLDGKGHGSDSAVLAGIEWCILHRQQYGIRIVNLSLGTLTLESYHTDPLCQACEAATRAGLLVVTASGNRGRSVPNDPNSPTAYRTIDCPGNDPVRPDGGRDQDNVHLRYWG